MEIIIHQKDFKMFLKVLEMAVEVTPGGESVQLQRAIQIIKIYIYI